MATKVIKFTDAGTSSAQDSNTLLLSGTGGGNGQYPQTFGGITAGWNDAGSHGSNLVGGISGDALLDTQLTIAAGSGSTRIRVNRPAGTFNVRLLTGMPIGQYGSMGARIYDTDGTTLLYTRPSTDIVTDGDASPSQVSTAGLAKVTPGTADAGVNITTAGANFWVEFPATGSYFTRLSAIVFDDGAAAPVYSDFVITNPNSTYTVGVPLSPIVVQAKDQFAANYTGGGLPTMDVASLTLGVSVTGTLVVAANQSLGTWTFSDLVPTVGAVIPPSTLMPPVIATTARKAIWTTVPASASDGTLIGTAIVGRIATLLDVTDAAYVTPVRLQVRNGNGKIIGTSVVTPVAGVFTFPLSTVAVALDNLVVRSDVNLGIVGFEGQSTIIIVTSAPLAASLVLNQEVVPRSSSTDPVAVIRVDTVAGGSVLIKGSMDGVTFSLIDAIPYVGSTPVNTIAAAGSFFGRVNVVGLRAVRLEKTVTGVTVAASVLTITGV